MLNSVNLFCDLFLKTFFSKQKRHEALSLHVFSPHNYIEWCLLFLAFQNRVRSLHYRIALYSSRMINSE